MSGNTWFYVAFRKIETIVFILLRIIVQYKQTSIDTVDFVFRETFLNIK